MPCLLLLSVYWSCRFCSSFFFKDTATTEIYTTRHTLSLHDALPISSRGPRYRRSGARFRLIGSLAPRSEDHTSELQSRLVISYAVFCFKKKNILCSKVVGAGAVLYEIIKDETPV